ncbi:ATP-binding protein [Falsirhodobacter deserti]|uniref:ATP-binding protein n=1 Tax=Falsirhodobacter deserti TaxID=1365611 RepID=UPI003BA915B7
MDNLLGWAVMLIAAGLAALTLTFLGNSALVVDVSLSVTATFWTMAVSALVVWGARWWKERAQRAVLARLMDRDPAICFATDAECRICASNEAARRVAGSDQRTTMAALSRLFADPPAVLKRLQSRAALDGSAAEQVTTRQGTLTLNVHDGGRGLFLWRLDHAQDRVSDTPSAPEVSVAPLREMMRFEHVPLPLVIFAAEGRVLTANALARDMLQLQANEKATISDLFEGLGRSLSAWLQDVASGRLTAAGEVLRIRRSADSYVHVSLRRTQERGRTVVLAVLIDATAVRALETQSIQSQKMQAIGQLAGGIAHDFNNLLTAISGHCDLLLLRHDATDPEYADLMQIHQNANRAASLVGQLLAYSRKQTQKLETLELHEVLSDLAHLLNRLVGERVTLRLEHGPGRLRVQADRRQLEQVVMNLVVNARDAMKSGGVIRIETEALTLRAELRRNRAIVPPGDYVVVRVIDQGAGIEPDHLEKIFEPFFTTKRPGEGTGLGLSTVYGIVKQTGGYIFVDSTVGEGSVFNLYLPTAPEVKAVVKPPPAAPVVLPPGEGVILLVEDEAPVRAFASRALRLRGYTVLEAGSAEEALEVLEDPSLVVDAFVTDVVMPGMDGPTWVRQALQQRPDARIVFVSGYAQEAFADEQAQFPHSVFLPKPFSLNDLTTTVQRLLT